MKLPDGRKVRVYRVEYNVVAYVVKPVSEDDEGEFDVGDIPNVDSAVAADERVHGRWDYDELTTEDHLDFAMCQIHGGAKLFIDGEESETLVSELLVEPTQA
jgi:hypothetical protein